MHYPQIKNPVAQKPHVKNQVKSCRPQQSHCQILTLPPQDPLWWKKRWFKV